MPLFRSLLKIAVCCLLVTELPNHANASGFPDFDPKRESVVFGRLSPAKRFVPQQARDLTYARVKDGLIVRDGDNEGYWLGHSKATLIADGLARFRVKPGKRADLGVMVRVIEQSPIGGLCGYEVSFSRETVRLQRWDRGIARGTGAEFRIRDIGRYESLEVVVYLVGPQIIAAVFDGRSLKSLGTLAAHDTTYRKGRLGVRLGLKQDEGGVSLISAMSSSPIGKAPARKTYKQMYGRISEPDITPFGPERFAYLRAKDRSKLPAKLRARTVAADTAGELVLPLDPVELEQLRRRGIKLMGISGDVPWKTFNEPYRIHSDKPPVKTRNGFQLDQSYKNPKMVESLLRGYQKRYPQISTLIKVGQTHQGRTIWGLKISDNAATNEDEPSVLFDGAHHASELLSVEYTLDVVQQLLEGYGHDRVITKWVDSLEIICIPLVNPDGNHAFLELSTWYTRKNGRDCDGDGYLDPFEGVDLNRNYPFGWGESGSSTLCTDRRYQGPQAGSEPETQSVMKLAQRQHFVASLSFHTVGTKIFFPYSVPSAKHPRPDFARAIAKEIVADAPEQPNQRKYRRRHGLYSASGTTIDWLQHQFGTTAFILEGSNHNPPLETRQRAVVATRPVWKSLLDRVVTGPRISGHVHTSQGKPIAAEVKIREVRLSAGEQWMTRPRDGRFDRMVVASGNYTVIATAPGYASKKVQVRVGEGPAEVELKLLMR